MSKMLKNNKLSERPAIRTLFAISLCASLVAFGCTTDRNLADGDPVVTPGLRTSPTGGMPSGSEVPTFPPPMMSSSLETATMLAQQQTRVRVLGVTSPGNTGRPYLTAPTYTGRAAAPAAPVANDSFSANVVAGIPITSTARNAPTTSTASNAVNLASPVRVLNENGRIKISNQ